MRKPAALLALLFAGFVSASFLTGNSPAAAPWKTCATITRTVLSTVVSTVTVTAQTTTAPPPPPPPATTGCSAPVTAAEVNPVYRLGRTTHRTGAAAAAAVAYPAGVVPLIGTMRISDDYDTLASATKDKLVEGIPSNTASDLTDAQARTTAPIRQLIYTDPMAAGAGANDIFGVSENQAAAVGALATDTVSHLKIPFLASLSYLPLMDSVAYQDLFCNHMLAVLQTYPNLDGLYYDNVDYDYHNLVGQSVTADQYTTNALWKSKSLAFYTRVNEFFQSRGYIVEGNAKAFKSLDSTSDTGVLTLAWWDYLTYSGAFRPGRSLFDILAVEFWQMTQPSSPGTRITGSADSTLQFWDTWQTVPTKAYSLGADFNAAETPFAVTAADDKVGRYSKASLALVWDGGYSNVQFRSSSAMPPTDTTSWLYNLGQPTAVATTPQTNVSKRTFDNGIVIVNHSSGSITQDGHTVGTGDAYIGAP